MSQSYKNLVFRGAGVKGIAYSGAIQVLAEKGLYEGVEKVSGTSAGAITALLVALRYDSEDIDLVQSKTSFKDFMDTRNILGGSAHVVKKYGYYKGEYALEWLHGLVKGEIADKQTGKVSKLKAPLGLGPNATFEDLKNAGGRDLYIFATDVNAHQVVEFSYRKTPKVMLAEAARASMSIPLFFEAFRFSNNVPNDHLYVDGGLVYNYPISIFDDENGLQDDTLGFVILPSEEDLHKVHDFDYGHIIKYIVSTFETLLNGQEIELDHNKEEKARTVRINDCGVKATDFDLSDKDKANLKDSGKNATLAYLNNVQA